MTMTTATATTATAFLAALDPDWAWLIDAVGPSRLEAKYDGEPYHALIRAIAHQQLHGKAAETILGRFHALHPGKKFPAPEEILALDDATLRGCGFSGAKVLAIRDVALKRLEGVVPTRRAAQKLTDSELIERLTSIRGVGRWTVEMLLIFHLGRPDILPVDDFGVREGWRVLKKLPEQPKPKALAAIGEACSPHRSTAAWYLWRASELGKTTAAANMTGA